MLGAGVQAIEQAADLSAGYKTFAAATASNHAK